MKGLIEDAFPETGVVMRKGRGLLLGGGAVTFGTMLVAWTSLSVLLVDVSFH